MRIVRLERTYGTDSADWHESEGCYSKECYTSVVLNDAKPFAKQTSAKSAESACKKEREVLSVCKLG